jgi:hypothetical protein
MMTKSSYNGYRFPLEIIQQAIWLYVRFTLSFRDVEDWWLSGGSCLLRDRAPLGKPFRADDRSGRARTKVKASHHLASR